MFTGIIESCGTIRDLEWQQTNLIATVESDISSQLKVDQSISHDGVCLTVTGVLQNRHRVTAVQETLHRSTLSNWKIGQLVNLERAMVFGARLDGHLVQGHVDSRGQCIDIKDVEGSRMITFAFDREHAPLLVQKGSVAIDGVSLTVIDPGEEQFSVAIIPYTWEHTNFKNLQKGSEVNLEFDIMGKYFARMIDAYKPLLKEHRP